MGDGSQWQINASLAELEARHQGPDAIPEKGTTTLMIRNMPRSYTAEAIMCELKALSPRSNYDFVYLPWDTRRGSNISYAFLNFSDHESALRAFFALSGRMWSLVRTMKTCRVATAHIQGLPENLANYVANSGIQDDCPHAPTVFHNGQRLELRQAVRLFCTGDMLQRAAEAARAGRLSSDSPSEQDGLPLPLPIPVPEARPRQSLNESGATGNCQQSTDGRRAMEFRQSFRQFCQNIAQSQDDFVEPDECEEIPSNVQFWLRFRELCLQFSASSSVMPEMKFAQAMANPPPADDQIHGYGNNGSSNGTASPLTVYSVPTLARPPGLVRDGGKGQGFALPEDLPFGKQSHPLPGRLSSSSEQVVAPAAPPFFGHQNRDSLPTGDNSSGLIEFGMPEEERVPVPSFSMNGACRPGQVWRA